MFPSGSSKIPKSGGKHRSKVIKSIDDEIERVTEPEKRSLIIDAQRMGYKLSAAGFPGQEELDRLLRCHTHFSRENDRILNRLESLQLIRKGQLLPHELDV